jgi:hypothetical protein
MDAYKALGYLPCDSPTLESRYDKIAIFADATGEPRHAARQLPAGGWTSKLGDHVDIEHEDLVAVGGLFYGEPTVYMRRLRQDAASTQTEDSAASAATGERPMDTIRPL